MVVLTKVAEDKIVQQLTKRGRGLGIQIGVKTTGCSGLAYVLEYVDEYSVEEDTVNFPQSQFIILVSKKHLPYVQGMTVDYVRNGLNEGFEFRNPNERDRCGCGESFRI